MVDASTVYALSVKQELFGRNVENVFFYQKLDPLGTAADLRDAFSSEISPSMLDLQSSSVQWVSFDTKNLGDLEDFETFPTAAVGTAGSGDTLPAFNAVGYTLNPITRAVRPGSKRIAGILEAVQINGELVEPTYLDAVENFRIVLDDVLTGTDSDYQPVIVKRIKTAIPGTTPTQYRYTLPGVGDDAVLGLIKSASSNVVITSQVSRKD